MERLKLTSQQGRDKVTNGRRDSILILNYRYRAGRTFRQKQSQALTAAVRVSSQKISLWLSQTLKIWLKKFLTLFLFWSFDYYI